MSWSARLEFAPIVTPDGRRLVTLADARAYLLAKLPNNELTQIAAGELMKAADQPSQIYLHCAREAMSRAVHGTGFRPKPGKTTWKDKRKTARSPRA